MKYYDELLKIMEAGNWPDFERNAFLFELHSLAEKMYEKSTIEGYLASLLIFQQLAEKIVGLLIQYSNLLMQFSVLPYRIKHKDLNGKTFGQLISELESGLCDEQLQKLIETSKSLNNLRINLFHKITLKTSIKDIEKQAKGARKLYNQIYSLFEEIREEYHLSLKDYNKYPEEYKEIVEDYIKNYLI